MKTQNPSLKTYVRAGKTKVSDNSLKCRMCLSRFTDMIEIFLFESEHLSNISIIHFCTGLEISENDGLPTRMCTECYRNLMDFFAFKRMCLASDTRLKTSRDAAIKQAETPEASIDFSEPEVKVEPQDELSLAENSDMVLLETDGFHPDAPDEVFSQIAKFEFEEECSARNWNFPSTTVTFVEEEEEEDPIGMGDEGEEIKEEEEPIVLGDPGESPAEIPDESTTLQGPPLPSNVTLEKNLQAPTSQKSFVCPTCSKQFRAACSLSRHKFIHVGPLHSCPHCQKQFNQKDSLKRHLLTHMDRRFVCAECSKVLISRAGLKCHIRTHHTDRSQNNNYFKYKCQVCNKSFAHASGLSRHMAIHRGVKYECSLCPKKFNDSSQLKRHKRVHLKDVDGTSEDMKKKELDANNYCTNDALKVSRTPVSPQALDYRLNRRETSLMECSEQERKANSNNCIAKDVLTAVIMPECRNGVKRVEEKVLKVPCNSKIFGEERPKYVVLQAL